MIQTINLSKAYDSILAVDHFNFQAHKGEIIALLGPNGAGKSTLMNMMTGFLAPTSGEILICGMNIASHPLEIKNQIGFLPEGSPLYPDMSVRMFLKYMAEIRGVGKDDIERAIELANISQVMTQKIETLSKGYLRRVGFAQSILSNPSVLLLDEPTDGLDPNQKDHMRQLIAAMGTDKTILISTHLLDEAETLCNRIVLINRGHMMADGTCRNILKQTKTKTLHDAFASLTETKEF
jgi:ABC-2 type transport system ATP-binding protein